MFWVSHIFFQLDSTMHHTWCTSMSQLLIQCKIILVPVIVESQRICGRDIPPNEFCISGIMGQSTPAKVWMEVVHKCGYEILPHPPYSPELVPSYFHFFPKLKKQLWSLRFEDDDELTAAVAGWLGENRCCVLPMTGKLDGINVWSWKGTMLKNKAAWIQIPCSFYVRLKPFWYPLV